MKVEIFSLKNVSNFLPLRVVDLDFPLRHTVYFEINVLEYIILEFCKGNIHPISGKESNEMEKMIAE